MTDAKTKVNESQIRYIIFLCIVGLVRLYYYQIKDSLKGRDKYTANLCVKPLNLLFKEYDRRKLDNMPVYDNVTNELIDFSEKIFEHIKTQLDNE